MNSNEHCKTCPPRKHCCVFKENSGFTFVSLANAKEIQKKINKDPSFFLDYSPLPKNTIKILKDSDPALEGYLRYSLLDKKGRLLRLKTKTNGKCIFLGENKKCEIYDVRPNVCRIYPLWGIRLIDDSLKVITHEAEPVCPILKSMDAEDIEKEISKEEIKLTKKLFKLIEKEAVEYAKDSKEEFYLTN